MKRFRACRKTTPIQARLLTQQDYIHHRGVIQTLEGPAPFAVGDYLARDRKGVWPIRRNAMRRGYQRVSQPDQYGWAFYCSLEVREACQMPEPFTVGNLRGKPGDFLVRSGKSAWPVDRELFYATYTFVR